MPEGVLCAPKGYCVPEGVLCAPKGYCVPEGVLVCPEGVLCTRRGTVCPEGVLCAPKGYCVPEGVLVCPEGVSCTPKGYKRQMHGYMRQTKKLCGYPLEMRSFPFFLFGSHKKGIAHKARFFCVLQFVFFHVFNIAFVENVEKRDKRVEFSTFKVEIRQNSSSSLHIVHV